MRYQLAMTLTVSVEAELSLMAVWTLGDFNSLLAKPGHHALDADGKKVLRLNSSIRYCALRPGPQLPE
jgi:hypothetical protein